MMRLVSSSTFLKPKPCLSFSRSLSSSSFLSCFFLHTFPSHSYPSSLLPLPFISSSSSPIFTTRRSTSLFSLHRKLSSVSTSSLSSSSSLEDGLYQQRNTIFGVATAPGKSGVAIIRISGPAATKALSSLTRNAPLPQPRLATTISFWSPSPSPSSYDEVKGEEVEDLIDKGLVVFFPGPRSFTGEDVVELHVHGSRAVLHHLLEILSTLPGLRSSLPGEFTKRAFLNGKLDLTEVEALADLINSETDQQRRQALRQLNGELRMKYEGWREDLIRCLAHLEAIIDFGEDENLDQEVADKVTEKVSKLLKDIESHLNDARRGERLRTGALITLVGPPNAGKSSLLNILAQRRVAIVSALPGTTRDAVEVVLDYGGYPVVVADTAGLRPKSDDPIELEGQQIAKTRLKECDLVICVLDLDSAIQPALSSSSSLPTISISSFLSSSSFSELDPIIVSLLQEQQRIEEGGEVGDEQRQRVLLVFNKSDLLPSLSSIPSSSSASSTVFISCQTGEGIPELLKLLEREVRRTFGERGEEGEGKGREGGGRGGERSLSPTRARHREHLSICVRHLRRYLEDPLRGVEFSAEELRLASKHLGNITGTILVDEILDVLFKDFCIGK